MRSTESAQHKLRVETSSRKSRGLEMCGRLVLRIFEAMVWIPAFPGVWRLFLAFPYMINYITDMPHTLLTTEPCVTCQWIAVVVLVRSLAMTILGLASISTIDLPRSPKLQLKMFITHFADFLHASNRDWSYNHESSCSVPELDCLKADPTRCCAISSRYVSVTSSIYEAASC